MRTPDRSAMLSMGVLLVPLVPLALMSVDAADRGPLDPPAGIELPERGISSHRGANHTHPENTLPAFREAIRVGAHQIELDVRLTADGELVVIHDATLDRTTDGSGEVAEATLAEIRELDAGSWKAPKFAGVRVPTLAEALEMMPHNVWLNLDLKGGYELGAAVAEEVLEHDRAYQAFLAARRDAADGARSVYEDILICNMTRREDYDRYVDETIEHGDAFIQLLRRMGTDEQMRRLEEEGIIVNYCCTDDPEDLERMYDAGIHFPLVDDLHPMMERAEALGVEPLEPAYLDR